MNFFLLLNMVKIYVKNIKLRNKCGIFNLLTLFLLGTLSFLNLFFTYAYNRTQRWVHQLFQTTRQLICIKVNIALLACSILWRLLLNNSSKKVLNSFFESDSNLLNLCQKRKFLHWFRRVEINNHSSTHVLRKILLQIKRG